MHCREVVKVDDISCLFIFLNIYLLKLLLSFTLHVLQQVLVSLFNYILIPCYLRQVNEVNGGDNVFVRCLSVCVCVCVCVQRPVNGS